MPLCPRGITIARRGLHLHAVGCTIRANCIARGGSPGDWLRCGQEECRPAASGWRSWRVHRRAPQFRPQPLVIGGGGVDGRDGRALSFSHRRARRERRGHLFLSAFSALSAVRIRLGGRIRVPGGYVDNPCRARPCTIRILTRIHGLGIPLAALSRRQHRRGRR